MNPRDLPQLYIMLWTHTYTKVFGEDFFPPIFGHFFRPEFPTIIDFLLRLVTDRQTKHWSEG